MQNQFSSWGKIELHLAPPLFARKDPATGLPRKMTFGPWMLSAFGILAKFKFLRGTPLDIFGYSHERKTERALIAEYEAWLDEVKATLSIDNHALAVAISTIPEKIRGFGYVKERHLKAAVEERAALLAQYRAGPKGLPLAAE